MAESRLTRRTVKQSKSQLYWSLGGIAVVLIIAFTIGPTLLSSTGSLIDKITGKSSEQAAIKGSDQVQPPTLDLLPDATPSAQISVSGRADYQEGKAQIYVNGSLGKEVNIDSSQTFRADGVRLSEGDNLVKARILIGEKKSDFSDEQKISYVKSAPKLDVSYPSDHQSFSKADQEITVKGTTDSDNAVSVNGFVAIVDSQGNFSYQIKLNNGDNKITVVATGPAGNSTTKELTVSYSQ